MWWALVEQIGWFWVWFATLSLGGLSFALADLAIERWRASSVNRVDKERAQTALSMANQVSHALLYDESESLAADALEGARELAALLGHHKSLSWPIRGMYDTFRMGDIQGCLQSCKAVVEEAEVLLKRRTRDASKD